MADPPELAHSSFKLDQLLYGLFMALASSFRLFTVLLRPLPVKHSACVSLCQAPPYSSLASGTALTGINPTLQAWQFVSTGCPINPIFGVVASLPTLPCACTPWRAALHAGCRPFPSICNIASYAKPVQRGSHGGRQSALAHFVCQQGYFSARRRCAGNLPDEPIRRVLAK